MKRFGLIIGAGLLICAAAYCGAYFCGTAPARRMAQEKYPELVWLKKEFNLSDAEFTRIAELHAAYQPCCGEMCQKIAAKNAEVREALAKSGGITPEVEQKLAEAAAIRAECQKAMEKGWEPESKLRWTCNSRSKFAKASSSRFHG